MTLLLLKQKSAPIDSDDPPASYSATIRAVVSLSSRSSSLCTRGGSAGSMGLPASMSSAIDCASFWSLSNRGGAWFE